MALGSFKHPVYKHEPSSVFASGSYVFRLAFGSVHPKTIDIQLPLSRVAYGS